jgi:2-iminoacetate synthase ThiH
MRVTGGFMCFVPLAFDPRNTELAHLSDVKRASGLDYLRTVAIS